MAEKFVFQEEGSIGVFEGLSVCYQRPLHFHDCLEMNLIMEGHGTNFVEDRVYEMSKGELYLLNNFEHHISMSDGTLKMKVLVFYPEFVWQNVPENYDYLVAFYRNNTKFKNRIMLTEDAYQYVLNCFLFIENEVKEKKSGWELLARAKLMEILAYIYRYADCETATKSAMNAQLSYERIRNSIDYIHQNYKTEISLEYLAGLSCMSRTYFSKYFKNTMNVTVTEYVEQIRINHAQCEVAGTDKAITEICFDCGYHNVSSFNVAFKKHCGMSPSAYRKHTQQKS